MRALLAASLLLVGCPTGDPPPDPSPPPEGWSWSETPTTCADPLDGVGLDRFTEVGVSRGLTEPLNPNDFGTTHLLVEDINRDDVPDIVVGSQGGFPRVYLNTGTANFVRQDQEIETGGGWSPAMGLADLNGDDLPEFVAHANGKLILLTNLNNGWFAPNPDQTWGPNESRVTVTTSFADVDGDGDLDIAAPHMDDIALPPSNNGTSDHLLIMDGMTVESARELYAPNRGSRALITTFTDFDGDLDPDLFVPSDLQIPAALWVNDGGGNLTDSAFELGADLQMGAMGIDSHDMNGDGRLDYCITDTGPPRCLFSEGSDSFIEGTAAVGLTLANPLGAGGTIGWSLDIQDLDNDGILDAVQSSGAMHASDANTSWPDLMWQGTDDGFVDVSEETGFADTNDNYALATADMNADGWLDIVVAGTNQPPRLYMAQCGSASWMEIELDGPPRNTQGFGAQVRVTAGGRTTIREVYSVRAQAQTPSRVHIGLGSETSATVSVTWPDGEVAQATDVPSNRLVRVIHPAAE